MRFRFRSKLKYRYGMGVCCLLAGMLILAGCTRHFDGAGYVTSMMDALYKGDYTAYADFTGLTTSDASLYRNQWLSGAADRFIAMTGAGTPSEEMHDRTTDLFKKIYANARYEVTADEETGAIQMKVSPMTLLTDNYDSLQAYVDDFNAKNEAYAFASLSDQEFCDTYLDGLLKILESQLSGLSYGEAVQIDIPISQDADGLYTVSPDTLTTIQENILEWP